MHVFILFLETHMLWLMVLLRKGFFAIPLILICGLFFSFGVCCLILGLAKQFFTA